MRVQNRVIWSSSPAPPAVDGVRVRRSPWWLRTAGLLAIIGIFRLARIARARWEPLFLLAGLVLAVAGVMMSVVAAFFAGLAVLIATLLLGMRQQSPGF
jgi:hypothetical protein